MSKKVLSLGQCGADDYAITQFLGGAFSAEVVSADTAAEALVLLREDQFALVLVNRLFDADGDSGLAFISQLKEDPALAGVSVMLVSNYPDVQKQAEARGALPGFGKAGLGQPQTLARLKVALS